MSESSSAHRSVPTPRWPVVLFDLDGTLADTIGLIVASYQHTFRSVSGRHVGDVEARSWIGQTLTETFTREDADQAAELEQVYLQYNGAKLDEFVTEYPGIPELLADLVEFGVTTGVVTSKRRLVASRSMTLGRVPQAIPLVCGMEDSSKHKPHPEPLLVAMDRLGVSPSRCVYVGDAIFDIQAAHAAGMAAIGVSWGAAPRADLLVAEPLAVADDADVLYSLLLG